MGTYRLGSKKLMAKVHLHAVVPVFDRDILGLMAIVVSSIGHS